MNVARLAAAPPAPRAPAAAPAGGMNGDLLAAIQSVRVHAPPRGTPWYDARRGLCAVVCVCVRAYVQGKKLKKVEERKMAEPAAVCRIARLLRVSSLLSLLSSC